MRNLFRSTSAVLLACLLLLPCFAAQALIPGGEAVGLELDLTAPCIIKTEDGSPAAQAGLKAGDCIVTVNQNHLKDAQTLLSVIETGKPLIVGIRRNGKAMTFTVYPQKTAQGFRIGAEVADSLNGIGTITYYDPEHKTFGALGHGVNLPNTRQSLPVCGGAVCAAEVCEAEKSESGEPGELKGSFSEKPIGTVTGNTENGIFGTLSGQTPGNSAIPVASFSQVHPGDAVIRSCVSGTSVREYSVQILEVYPHAEGGRDLLLIITDEDLLSQTGGIVRGMSGSPIIQDGRLVGAVTHVLVDNPVRGYGIFIENMLAAAEEQRNAA